MQSVFFWSEEHAREYRLKHSQVDGTYLTLAQAAVSDRVAQGALFAIDPDGRLRR